MNVPTARTASRRFRITDPCGLHVRPCTAVASAMQRFRCTAVLTSDGTRADPRSIMDLLALAAGRGAELELVASGDDAAACVDAIAAILRPFSCIE